MPAKAKPQGFIPNSFFKEREHSLRSILARPVDSPGDFVANIYDLLDFANKFVIDLQKIVHAPWATEMLQTRRDSLRDLLNAAKQQAEVLDRNVLYEAGDIRGYLRFRFILAIQDAFKKKAKTTKNALKYSWLLQAGYVDTQVDKLLAGASPDVLKALDAKSDSDRWDSNAGYVIHNWDTKVGFDRLAQKALLIEKGPTRLANLWNWVSWMRDLLEANYGSEAIGDPTSEFDLYGLKIVVEDRTVTPGDIQEYVRYFDAAHELLKRKGLGAVWRGNVFIRCTECGGKNPLGEHFGVGGDYTYTTDTINVYMRPRKDLVRLMVHELGHRYWFKGMSKGQRGRFESYVRVNGPGPEDPDTRDVAPVSEYGAQNIEEAFAEVFKDYVIGKDLDADQLESFRAVLKRASVRELAFRRIARRILANDYRVRVTFRNEISRAKFEAAWIKRAGRPIDAIENGVEYAGDNAERAVDIAGEIDGVTITEI